MKSKRRNLKVPMAPQDLFIKIRRRIRRNERALNMKWWHGRYTKDGRLIYIYPCDKVECATAHCLAGWITWLTPGGLELEKEIQRRWSESEPLNIEPTLAGWAEFKHSATAVAALLITRKAGWRGHITWTQFTTTDQRARELIESFAEMEKEALTKEKQRARRRVAA